MTAETRPSLAIHELFGQPMRAMLHPAEPALQKLLSLDRLLEIYDAARASGAAGEEVVHRLLATLRIAPAVAEDELARIPRTGPAIIAANHPFGLVEAAVLFTVLPRIRSDVRFLANRLLSVVPELGAKCIFVDAFGGSRAARLNGRPLREALRWLCGGGMLVAFPAGEVSHLQWTQGAALDPPWNPAIARLAMLSRADVFPVFFYGSNSLPFHLSGVIHPSLRTAALGRELLNKQGKRITFRVGHPVAPRTLDAFGDSVGAVEYLRFRTFLLNTEKETVRRPFALWGRKPAPISGAVPAGVLSAEVAQLPPDSVLCQARRFEVRMAAADQAPQVLREIGRLREVTFRAAGEGSNKSLDLDSFDRHYLHLFLWDSEARCVAGAYRMAATPDVLPHRGTCGLYTSTLFRYGAEFFRQLGPAIELGRSFIRAEYQKQALPLFLLWKGIGSYAARRGDCPVLFGPVSISKDYHPATRDVLVRFLRARQAEALATEVKPRHAYRASRRLASLAGPEALPVEIDEISEVLADVEPDGAGVPILVKHYLKLGGRLLALNVDPAFSNVLDALLVVDLRCTPAGVLEKYMGAETAGRFRAALSHARTVGG